MGFLRVPLCALASSQRDIQACAIRRFLSHEKIRICSLTETWANTDNLTDSLLSFGQFAVFRTDRIAVRGGGIALLVAHELSSTLVFSLSFSVHCQVLAVDVQLSPSRTVRFFVVYRSPSCSLVDFAEAQSTFTLAVVKHRSMWLSLAISMRPRSFGLHSPPVSHVTGLARGDCFHY